MSTDTIRRRCADREYLSLLTLLPSIELFAHEDLESLFWVQRLAYDILMGGQRLIRFKFLYHSVVRKKKTQSRCQNVVMAFGRIRC